jgi:hypothetical protein
VAKTGLRLVPEAFFARAGDLATGGLAIRSGTSCGIFVGILTIAAGACAMGLSLFLRYRRKRADSRLLLGGRYWARTSDLPVVSRLLFR